MDDFFGNWTTQFRKGVLELCVLNTLNSRRLYGYDIVRVLRETEGLVISEGTIYPILSRFKQGGLVRTTLEESQEGPARKYYELTDRGREQLMHMNNYWIVIQASVNKLRGAK